MATPRRRRRRRRRRGRGSDANGGGADAIAAVEKVVSLGAELKRTLTTAGGLVAAACRGRRRRRTHRLDRGSRAVLGRTVRELNRQQLQVAALREKLSVVEASAASSTAAAAAAGSRSMLHRTDQLAKAHEEVESLQSEVARLSQTAEAEKGYSEAMDAECERLKKAYADLTGQADRQADSRRRRRPSVAASAAGPRRPRGLAPGDCTRHRRPSDSGQLSTPRRAAPPSRPEARAAAEAPPPPSPIRKAVAAR